MSVPVPLMTGSALPQNPGILASRGNPVSYVQVVGRNNISPALLDQMPYLGLDPDNLDPIPEILAKQKPFASFSNYKKADPSSPHQYPQLRYPVHPLSLSLWSESSQPWSPCLIGEVL